MRTHSVHRRGLRALLAAIALLLCTSGLVAGVADPAAAAPKPARVKGVKLVRPTIDGATASLTVKWKRTARARSHKVKWWPEPKTGARSERTRGRSHTITGLAQGASYCAKVRAYNGKRKGRWSKVVCRTTPRLAPGGAVWMDAQQVDGATTTLGIRWHRVEGAASYELDYAPGDGSVQNDKKKRTVTVPAGGAAVEGRVVGGFEPGRVYCFQVRALNRYGAGLRGPTHCKYTMPVSRAARPAAFTLDAGTYNICSNVCKVGSQAWSARRDGVAERILAADLDVIGVQEAGNPATNDLTADLDGYGLGCRVGDGSTWNPSLDAQARNQALFVRSSTYSVVAGTASGIRFSQVGDVSPTHGACWVEVQHRATGRRLLVASVHLVQPIGASWDAGRAQQTAELMAAIGRQYPLGSPPVVLVGDFNSHRSRATDAPREHLETLGFHDSYDVAASYLSPPFQNSAHGWNVVPVTSWRWGDHLDHVFAPAGAHVASWQILEPQNPDGTYARLLSDHSLLRVSLQFP